MLPGGGLEPPGQRIDRSGLKPAMKTDHRNPNANAGAANESQLHVRLFRRMLEVEKFAETAGLGAAHGDFGLFLVIHAQLVGAFEPGDDFADVVDVD